MLIDHNILWRGFAFAPSGSGAEAVVDVEAEKAASLADDAADDTADDEGADETDDEQIGEDGEEVESPDDKGGDPEPSPLKDVFGKLGLNDVPDDPTALGGYISGLQRQAQQARQYEQMIAYQHRQQQEAEAAAKKQKQAEETQAKREPLWSIPKFDRQLLSQLTRDEDGNIVAKPGALPTIPQDYHTWQSSRDAAIDKALEMLADPVKFYQEQVAPHVGDNQREQITNVVREMMDQQSYQNERNSYIEKNSDWLIGADGQLTPAGQRLDYYLRMEQEAGIRGFRQQIERAEARLDQEVFRYRLSQEGTKEKQVNERREKDKKLLHSSRKFNRSGSFGNTAGKKKVVKDPEDHFRELEKQLKALGPDAFDSDVRSTT